MRPNYVPIAKLWLVISLALHHATVTKLNNRDDCVFAHLIACKPDLIPQKYVAKSWTDDLQHTSVFSVSNSVVCSAHSIA